MKERKIEFTLKNISLYIVGFFVIGLGVILMERSDIGVGAWDATNFNFNALLNNWLRPATNITYGTTSLIISFVLFFSVITYRTIKKQLNWKLLIMIIPMFAIALAIDFWDIIAFSNFYRESAPIFEIGILLFVLGMLTIPLGLVMIITSNFPATVYDEFTIMMTEITKAKSFGNVRMGFEITGVLLAVIFTTIAKLTLSDLPAEFTFLGDVGVGTVFMAFIFGHIMNIYLILFKMAPEEETEQLLRNLNHVKSQVKLHRILKYIIGMPLIAVGVSFMLKSDLGNSSWDTLHFSMEHLFNITFGTATIIVALAFTAVIIVLNKNYKYLLMAIPILIVGPLIDVTNVLLDTETVAELLWLQITYFLIGITLLPLGGAFLLISTYPAGVFDEFNVAVVRKLKLKSLVPTRVIMELTAVLTAGILGYLAGFVIEDFKFGKIGVGTIIFALTVGTFLKTYLKLFERIGLSETK